MQKMEKGEGECKSVGKVKERKIIEKMWKTWESQKSLIKGKCKSDPSDYSQNY